MYVKHRKLILLSVVCVVCTLVQRPVFAYTSTLNPQHPATAPDSYVINIPDANLKAALNQIIANVSPVSTRTPDQSITVKDAKRVSLMYGPQSLNTKGITNLEGIQYFTNVNSLYVVNNTPNITDTPLNIRPLQALKKLKTLIISRNNLPQNLLEEVIPHLTLLETLDIARNRATDLTPLLTPLNNLRALTLEGNKFTTLDALITKTGLTYLNLNANTLSNTEIQKLGALTNLKTLLISAILPANTFSDLSFLASLNQLEDLRLNNNRAITTLESALASKNTLKRLEIINNELSEDVLPQVAQFTNITEIRAGGNKLYDISSLASLHQITEASKSSFPDQVATKTTLTQVLPNPIKNRDGSIVPITETIDVINVDASGTPDQNGGYIKVKKEGQGTVTVNWQAPLTPELHKHFSGILTINYDIDLTPPTVTITSPTSITAANATTYPVTGTCSEIGKPVTITIGTLTPLTVTCEAGGIFSLAGGDVSSLPEGNIDITASQENRSAVKGETTTTVQKDTTPPTITITNANTDPAQSKTVSATATDGTISGYVVVPAGTSCDASLTYTAGASATLSNESDNGNIVCFKAEDALGNASFSASAPIAGIDRTAPVINSAEADISGGVNAPVIKFAGQDAGSGIKEWKITVDGNAPVTLPATDTDTSYTPIGLVGTSHVIKIQAIDHAGNSSVERVLRFPPSVKITSPKVESNQPIAGVNIKISGPAELKIKKIEVSGAGNPALTCTDTGIPSDTNLVEVPFTCTLADIATTGKLEVKVTSEDNIIGSSEQDYVIDTENPILTLNSVAAKDMGSDTYLTNQDSTTVVFSATDAGGATANLITECSVDGGNSWEECTSPYTLQLPTATTTLKIRAKDGTGNLSAEKEITVKKDTQAPAFDPAAPVKIIARKDTEITLTDVQANDGVDGSGLDGAGVVITTSPQLDTVHPAPGNYTVTYTVSDEAGNVTSVNREVEITDADALQAEVDKVTPALLNGKTPASIAAVNQAKQEAETLIAQADASQAALDAALAKLQTAIANLANINQGNTGNSGSSSGYSGGGGGASLIRDYCPQGDFSRSYYDNSCGDVPHQDQNPDPQSPAIPTDNEMIDAYKRAFENGITTQPSLADARLLDYLTRAELAKMLSIFTLKYTDRQPILDKPFCDTYSDADQVNAELSSYMTTACKLEIMGLHSDGKTPLDAFMPNKYVSRAELVTVLSRVLYGNTYDNNTADQRWQGHMDKLHTDTVIKDPTPSIQEIRAYVLLMMYRIKGK